MEEQGRVQALAGGAARVGGREGAAAAQTKPAAAADGTVMLVSLGAAAGTPGSPCICTEPCSASPPGLLGAISAKPSAHLLARGGGQCGQGEGISGCREQGLRGHRAAPQPGHHTSTHTRVTLGPAGETQHEAGAVWRPRPCPGAGSSREGPCRQQLGGNSAAGNY